MGDTQPNPRVAWQTGLVVAGFALSLTGLLIALPTFRLALLLMLAHDFGMRPIELAAVPFCLAGANLCCIGLLRRRFLWLSGFGVLLAVLGLLWAVFVAIALMTFDGGSV